MEGQVSFFCWIALVVVMFLIAVLMYLKHFCEDRKWTCCRRCGSGEDLERNQFGNMRSCGDYCV